MSDQHIETIAELNNSTGKQAATTLRAVADSLESAPPEKRYGVSLMVAEGELNITREIAKDMSYNELRQLADVDGSNPTKKELIENVVEQG